MEAVYIMDITILNWQGFWTGIRNIDIDMREMTENSSNIIWDRSCTLSSNRKKMNTRIKV